jgi:hypothetical protein
MHRNFLTQYRHVHAHKCLHCAGFEPATFCVVGEYSDHYAKSADNENEMYETPLVPKDLNLLQKLNRMRVAEDMIERVNSDTTFMKRIVNGDET